MLCEPRYGPITVQGWVYDGNWNRVVQKEIQGTFWWSLYQPDDMDPNGPPWKLTSAKHWPGTNQYEEKWLREGANDDPSMKEKYSKEGADNYEDVTQLGKVHWTMLSMTKEGQVFRQVRRANWEEIED
uniref:Uncharacterized protein n=1 Tax=Karlodinium veneficum TaxID=407301 RepID=A7WQ05_KARVE|nr:unknown [Karlodinium veneficum]